MSTSSSTSAIAAITRSGFAHEIIDCDPDLADTAAFCNHYGYSLDESANAILLVGKSDPPVYAMCVVLATTQVDVNKVGRKKLGVRKASFAPPELASELTGMTLGGVTPFGKPADLALWIDSRVIELDRVIVGGGSRDKKLYIDPAALLSLPNSEVVEGLGRERPPQPHKGES